MQTSVLQVSTTEVGMNTCVDVVTRDEFDTMRNQLTEASLRLEQSRATVEYLEGQLEQTREQPTERKNTSLNTSATIDPRIADLEQQLTVEKKKFDESNAIVQSLRLRNEELNQLYMGEKNHKDNSHTELNAIKGTILQLRDFLNTFLFKS